MITRLSVERPRTTIAVWLLLAAVAALLALQLGPHLKAGGFKDPEGNAFRGQAVAQEAFGDAANSLQVVLASPEPITDETLDRVAEAAATGAGVSGTSDYRDNPSLISSGRRTAVVNVDYDTTDTATQNEVAKLRATVREAVEETQVRSSVTGAPALDYDLNAQSKADALAAEMIAFPLLILVLLFVYRAVVPTLITLAMAGISIVGAHGVGYLFAREVDMSNLFTTGVSLIGLAVSIDYSLFVVKRYEEYLGAGIDPKAAILNAVATAGHAVRFGGLAVIAALAALYIPGNMVFSSIATAGIVVTAIAIAITTTMLPAVLSVLGRRAFKGRLPGYGKASVPRARTRLAHARPGLTAGVLAGALVLAAVPMVLIKLQVPVASAEILPATADSRKGLEMMGRDLDPASMFPIQVVLQGEPGGTPEALLSAGREIETSAQRSPLVQSVLGLASASVPQGRAADALGAGSEVAVRGTTLAVERGGAHFVRMMVISRTPPDTEQSHALVEDLREAAAASGFTSYVTGATSQGDDFDALVESSIPVILVAVLLLSLVLLGFAFRSALLPVVALGLNALVVLAALGLLTLVWQEVVGEPINSVTPILMFAIIFGLSMDYMVLMASRMKEEYVLGASHPLAIARGSERTSRLVSAAALIMIAVFMSFMVAEVSIVRQLGLGLAMAVVLDAGVVRPFLMPSTLFLLGPAVWGARRTSGRHAPKNEPGEVPDASGSTKAQQGVGHPEVASVGGD
ncbi:MMPL family transporter [Nocardioides jishulii]|uniref:MMPL family transporter n=1 Tax=Nocardioides jishulii TaxID=2575440 RepID=A0A4U2YLX2_9ACTN|nr:MMPL family transporter [Nocardioides jishulii]QCX27372.1 MMPL family transporter [Nocardioides jishulii]TKI62178.1 MMPL family transporter [Nocardioides jishulii]